MAMQGISMYNKDARTAKRRLYYEVFIIKHFRTTDLLVELA